MRRTTDDRRTLLARVILSPAALVLSPIQFVFDSPQGNSVAKSSFEHFFSVHRYTFFARTNFTTNMPGGSRKTSKQQGPIRTRPRTKKADMGEHSAVFAHVGLLTSEPLGTAELLSI